MGNTLHNAGAQCRFNRQLLRAFELRGGHDQRIFVVIVVVPNTTANFSEAEREIEPLGVNI